MQNSEFLKQLTNCTDICSLIAKAFEYLQVKSARELHKLYDSAIKNKSGNAMDIIDELITELSIITPYEFSSWINNWIYEFENTKLDRLVFCYTFLIKIDRSIREIVGNKKTISPGTNEQYHFYLKPNDGYFNQMLSNNKIRRGRQTVEYDVKSINSDFTNYQVVKSSTLNEYSPVVHYYSPNYKFDTKICIGASPISSQRWFTSTEHRKSKEITVSYNASTSINHNEKIKELLSEFDKIGTDIVVFPELAMNEKTENAVRELILTTSLQKIKLIFLGSLWNNNSNKAIIINNQGSVLLRTEKKTPYSKYNKKEACHYTEAIKYDNVLHFLDISGLGRIAYLICADFNDECLNNICHIMHTDFIFVSAFSNSTDTMLKTASDNAARKAISSILCNSCAAFGDDDTVLHSFAVIPTVSDGRLKEHIISELDMPQNGCCSTEQCSLCIKNMDIYKLYT